MKARLIASSLALWPCVFITFFSSTLHTLTSAKAPVAGGPGYALYFDHERTDTVSWKWDNVPQSAITIETWVRLVDPYLDHALISYGAYDSATSPIYEQANELTLIVYAGYIRVFRATDRWDCNEDESLPGHCNLRTNPNVNFGDWVHLAFTWDITTGSVAMYSNGSPAGSFDASSKPEFMRPLTKSGGVMMAQEQDAFMGDLDQFQGLDGMLDELRVWSVVRTPEEIMANYQLRLDPASYPGQLNVMFTLDELAGSGINRYLPDISGMGNDALFGRLPNLKNEMKYSTGRPTGPPSDPKMVKSGANVFGGPIVQFVSPDKLSEVVLRSSHEDGLDLTTVITSNLAACDPAGTSEVGELQDLDGAVLSAQSEVVDAERLESKRLFFHGPTLMSADWCATFDYSVSAAGETATATVILRAIGGETPPDKAYSASEDEGKYLILGGVSMDGSPVRAVITSLPHRGRLYQVKFQEGAGLSYNTIDFSNLSSPITSRNTEVENDRGIVMFIPEQDDYDDSGVYTTFNYAWRVVTDSYQTADAFVSVTVTSVNDAPIALSQAVSTTGETAMNIVLGSSDIDPTFADNTHYRITTWPRLGTLHQENGDQIENVERVPTIVSFVSAIPDYHVNTSTAAFSTQFSQCGACCYNQETCTMDEPECEAKCTSFAWHISQAIGEPDFYPEYGDTKLGWDLSTENGGKEYGVFEFPDPLYVSAVHVYETYVGGAVERIMGAREWQGADTSWSTLWQGTAGPVAAEARIFAPPTCPIVTESFKYIRLNLDTAASPGWNNYDAIKMEGSFEFPPGRVQSSTGLVSYRPKQGVHISNTTLFTDSFAFTASDCVDEGAEAQISVDIQAPQYGTGSTMGPGQTVVVQVGGTVAVNVSTEDCEALLGVESGSLTVQLLIAEGSTLIDASAMQWDGTPLELSRLPSVPLNDTANRFLFSVTSDSETDDDFQPVNLHAWATDGAVTCRTEIRFTQVCPAGTFGRLITHPVTGASTTQCVPCPRGTFSGTEGKSECTACVDLPAAQNYYQDEEGQTQCKRCPENTFRMGGQQGVDISECTCKEGYWQPDKLPHSEACVQCPDGGVCFGTHDDPASEELGRNYLPFPDENFWGLKQDPSLFLECDDGMCAGGEEFACVKGYEGRLCSECQEGHWSVGDDCSYKCHEDNKDVAQALKMIGITSIVIFVWLMMNRIVSEEHDSLDLLLQYLQIGDIISTFELRWTPKIASVQEIISVVNFEVDLVALWKCYMYWNYSWSFVLSLFLPAVVGLMKVVTSWRYILYYFLHARGKKNPPVRRVFGLKINKDTLMLANDELSTVFFSFLLVCYNNLCISSFSTFDCMEGPDGISILRAGPVITCWEGDHKWMILVSIFTLAVYVFGIPFFFARALLNGMRNNQLAEQTFLNRFGFIYTRYKVEYAGWELLLLLRNFLMCAVSVFFSQEPLLQAMLGIIVLGLALASHMHAQPFVQDRLNVLEFFSIVGNGLYIIFGVLMDSSKLYHSTEYLIYIIIVFVTLFGLGCFAYDIRDAFALRQATRNLTSRLSRQFLLNPDSAYGQVRTLMQLAEDAFDAADTDGNGTLSWMEVRAALTAIHEVSDETVNSFMKEVAKGGKEITRTSLRVFFLKRLTNFNTLRINEDDFQAIEAIQGRQIGKEAEPQLVRNAQGADVIPMVESPKKSVSASDLVEKARPSQMSFQNLTNLIKNRRWSLESLPDMNTADASPEMADQEREERLRAGASAWKKISVAINEVAPGKKQKGQKARLLRMLKHKANEELSVDELLGLTGSKEDLIREMAFTIKPRALRAWAVSSPSSSQLRTFHALDYVMTPLLSDSAAQSAYQLDPNAVMYRRFVTAFPFVIDWLVSYSTNKRAKQLRCVLDSMVDFYKEQGWTGYANQQGEFSELIVPTDTAPFATWLMATDDLSRERCKFLLRSISKAWKSYQEEQMEKSGLRRRVSKVNQVVKKRASVLRMPERKEESKRASIGRTVSIQNRQRQESSDDDDDDDEHGDHVGGSHKKSFSSRGSKDDHSYDNVYGNMLAHEDNVSDGNGTDDHDDHDNDDDDDDEEFDDPEMKKFLMKTVEKAMRDYKKKKQVKKPTKKVTYQEGPTVHFQSARNPRVSKSPTEPTLDETVEDDDDEDDWVPVIQAGNPSGNRRSWDGEEPQEEPNSPLPDKSTINDLEDFDREFLQQIGGGEPSHNRI